jgi:hypothetical protein
MKQRLKLFFAFLRGLKGHLVDTSILIDMSSIEDWDDKFDITNEQRQTKRMKLPPNLQRFIEELIKNHMDDFYEYLDLTWDDYWYLYINIYPFENRIVFTSSHKVEERESFNKIFNYGDLSQKNKETILQFYEDDEDLAKIEYEFVGRWDDGQVYSLELDGILTRIDNQMDENLWMIVNELMKTTTGNTYWNIEAGAEGHVTVWGDTIFIKGVTKDQDYEPTDMKLEINLDTYK